MALWFELVTSSCSAHGWRSNVPDAVWCSVWDSQTASSPNHEAAWIKNVIFVPSNQCVRPSSPKRTTGRKYEFKNKCLMIEYVFGMDLRWLNRVVGNVCCILLAWRWKSSKNSRMWSIRWFSQFLFSWRWSDYRWNRKSEFDQLSCFSIRYVNISWHITRNSDF